MVILGVQVPVLVPFLGAEQKYCNLTLQMSKWIAFNSKRLLCNQPIPNLAICVMHDQQKCWPNNSLSFKLTIFVSNEDDSIVSIYKARENIMSRLEFCPSEILILLTVFQ